MSDANHDPYARLARFYDLAHATLVEDIPFIQRLADRRGSPILELGCGTGRLLLALARTGHTITGVDASPAMLAIARERLAAEPAEVRARCRLIHGEMAHAVEAPAPFRLALLAFNTLMHVPPPRLDAVLTAVARALAPGGALFVDLANPASLAALPDDPAPVLEQTLRDPASGADIRQWARNRLNVTEQWCETEWRYEVARPPAHAAAPPDVRATVRLHFYYPHQLELALQAAGLRLAEMWGGYDGERYDEAAERLIIVARR